MYGSGVDDNVDEKLQMFHLFLRQSTLIALTLHDHMSIRCLMKQNRMMMMILVMMMNVCAGYCNLVVLMRPPIVHDMAAHISAIYPL